MSLFLSDSATVIPYTGVSAGGPVYGAGVTVTCRAEFDRKLVRNSNGDEVVSEATLYVLPINGTDVGVLFAPESRVTVNGAHDSQVISVAPRKTLGPSVHHYEVTLR